MVKKKRGRGKNVLASLQKPGYRNIIMFGNLEPNGLIRLRHRNEGAGGDVES